MYYIATYYRDTHLPTVHGLHGRPFGVEDFAGTRGMVDVPSFLRMDLRHWITGPTY